MSERCSLAGTKGKVFRPRSLTNADTLSTLDRMAVSKSDCDTMNVQNWQEMQVSSKEERKQRRWLANPKSINTNPPQPCLESPFAFLSAHAWSVLFLLLLPRSNQLSLLANQLIPLSPTTTTRRGGKEHFSIPRVAPSTTHRRSNCSRLIGRPSRSI